MMDHVYEFCGCDVHKNLIEVAWLDVTGQLFLHGSFDNTPEGNKRFWKECKRLQTTKVAMESTGIYWKALYNSCPKGISSSVFNAASIKLKTRPKTDVKDAMWIARCLRAGFISPSNITSGQAITIKELCRLRATIVSEITRKKNNIHKILDEHQRKLTSFTSGMNTQLALFALTILAQQGSFSDLKQQVPSTRLTNVINKHETSLKQFFIPILPFEAALALDLSLRGLLERSEACLKVENHLGKFIEISTVRQPLRILNSIPGVSGVSALQLYVEIGRVDRFPSKRNIVAWAGLCPRVSSSGGKTTRGQITKRGNSHVRRILFIAARASLRAKNNPLKNWYSRLKSRKSGKVALVALARKLLIIAYTLLKKGETFYQATLSSEVKVISTAKRLVRGLTGEKTAPLFQVLVDWLDYDQQYGSTLPNLLTALVKVVPSMEVTHCKNC
jgi:transposase